MLNKLRTKAYGVLASDVGNGFLPVRAARKVANYANDVTGRFLADEAELLEREQPLANEPMKKVTRDQAPVTVFHVGRNPKNLERIKLVLEGRNIKFTISNIEEDPAAKSAVMRDGNGPLPLTFVAGECVGGAIALANMDQRGELVPLVFGDDAR